MSLLRLDVDDRQVVMHTAGAVCASTQELVESTAFARVLGLYLDHLEAYDPTALDDLGIDQVGDLDHGRDDRAGAGDPRRARLLGHALQEGERAK